MLKAMVKQSQIDTKVRRLAKRLRPDVQDIKYTIEPDWSGDPGIFFRVLITDEAGAKRLRDIATKVRRGVSEILNRSDMAVFPYFDFRSESEQAALRDKAWI